MYITKNLVTSTRNIAGQSYELTSDLEAKFWKYKAFSKLVFDDDDNLIDIVEDIEKKENQKAEEEAEKPDPYEANVKDIRTLRRRYLNAFDIYKSNVEYGIVSETDEQHQLVLDWYNQLLNITDLVTAESIPEFPEVPNCVKQYL